MAFLILTKNEEHSIANLISDLSAQANALQLHPFKIFVVDDSTDQTSSKAKAANAIVFQGENRGLGAAYKLGLKQCLEQNPEFIITLDGDGQVDTTELKDFFVPLTKGYDLVLGSRFQKTNLVQYRYPKMNLFGSRILSFYLSLMAGQKLTDSHGGFRAMKASVARQCALSCDHTYVQETIIEAAEAKFKILEIPSAWNKRQVGSSKVVGSIPKYIRKVGPTLAKRFVHKAIFGQSR